MSDVCKRIMSSFNGRKRRKGLNKARQKHDKI